MIERDIQMPINLNETNHFPPLQRRQQQVLEFVAWSRLRRKYFPYHKEIDQACFIGGSPFQILKGLFRKGYIKLGDGKHRAVRITEQGQAYLNKNDLKKWDERAKCKNYADIKKWLKKYKILNDDGLRKWTEKYIQ